VSTVDVKATAAHQIAIEWVGSATNDMVADAVLALIVGIDSSPASVKSE
jgi:cleavage and polyadenylation specificity factor subunit 3